MLAYYVSIIAKVRATEERYLLPFAILLAVAAGVAVGAAFSARRLEKGWPRVLGWALVFGLLAQQFVWSFVPVTYTQLFDTKRALARSLHEVAPPGSPLLIVDMASFNVPNRDVYERYRLMHPPGEMLRPPSTHGENIFKPYDASYRYILAGNSAEPGHPLWPKADARLVRAWTYPEWVRSNVYVPSIYEFYLYERREGAGQKSGR